MDDLHYLTLWISNFMEAVLLRRLSFSVFLFELRNYRAIEPSLFIKLIKVFYNLYHSISSMLWIFLFADLIFQFFLPIIVLLHLFVLHVVGSFTHSIRS